MPHIKSDKQIPSSFCFCLLAIPISGNCVGHNSIVRWKEISSIFKDCLVTTENTIIQYRKFTMLFSLYFIH